MELSEASKKILAQGSISIRLRRAGMYQFQTFAVKRVKHGNGEFVELFLDKVIDMPELLRIAKETGLPVESQNGRAFPEGKGAKDFMGL